MKSSQTVYPFSNFSDLTKKTFKSRMLPLKKASTKRLQEFLRKLAYPNLTITGNTIASQLLSIFLDKSILFGPRSYVTKERNQWLEKFNYFVSRNKRIELIILGFPFKIPVPLKTNRTLPDMGEVLSLRQLFGIVQNITKLYKPGAHLTVCTEGGFAQFNSMSQSEQIAYRKELDHILVAFGWNKQISILPLDKMEKMKGFSSAFKQSQSYIRSQFVPKNKELWQKYLGAYDSIYRIVNTRDSANSDWELLMNVYNDALADSILTPTERKLRNLMKKAAKSLTYNYFSYLKARDKLGFIEHFLPHAIHLSVSPKPGRLGVYPINKYCSKLPYHGVPVFDTKKRKFSIEYLVDVVRKNATYQPVFWSDDGESKPFYYVKK